jgi:hypothetical protein
MEPPESSGTEAESLQPKGKGVERLQSWESVPGAGQTLPVLARRKDRRGTAGTDG